MLKTKAETIVTALEVADKILEYCSNGIFGYKTKNEWTIFDINEMKAISRFATKEVVGEFDDEIAYQAIRQGRAADYWYVYKNEFTNNETGEQQAKYTYVLNKDVQ